MRGPFQRRLSKKLAANPYCDKCIYPLGKYLYIDGIPVRKTSGLFGKLLDGDVLMQYS